MTGKVKKAVYAWLTEAGAAEVRVRLTLQHEYFYHFSPLKYLTGIKRSGIDPLRESKDSSYARRTREPGKAMRYCTRAFPQLGLSAAHARDKDWSPQSEMWLPGAGVVLLRTKAINLLDRPFGIDHSFAEMDRAGETILQSQAHFEPDQFIDLVARFGSVSCYEAIPPDDLDILAGASLSCDGPFIPLQEHV